MIYPWYDEERWLAERFRRDPAEGRRILREYGPPPAEVHFRHGYASFRVKGLEYARLSLSGKVTYGIKNAPLDLSAVPPRELVTMLSKMFMRLASFEGHASALFSWIQTIAPPILRHFIEYVSVQHQPEHWLESELLRIPGALSRDFVVLRSQVVVGEMGQKKPFKFIDLLALDRANLLVWIIELKVPKAAKAALRQMAGYLAWAESKLPELFDESRGYFAGVDDPEKYGIAAAFAAPEYTANFDDYLGRELLGFPVRVIHLNADWRQAITVTATRDFEPERVPEDSGHGVVMSPSERSTSVNETVRLWVECSLIDLLIKKAISCGDAVSKRVTARSIHPDNRKFRYIDLDGPAGVFAQLHKDHERGGGCILVIGNADEKCPNPEYLDEISDYSRLSGDGGPNKAWLRATGEVFGHLSPARCFFVTDDSAKDTYHRGWQDVTVLLGYALRRS
jgi:hypothetical protein